MENQILDSMLEFLSNQKSSTNHPINLSLLNRMLIRLNILKLTQQESLCTESRKVLNDNIEDLYI